MVHISPFKVEEWMDRLETTPGVLNIAETCCESVSVEDLYKLADRDACPPPLDLTSRKLTYGHIEGSPNTRQKIANLYRDDGAPDLDVDNVLVTQGAIGANFLTLYALISAGDHVICVYPTYEQLYEVPMSIGADVTLWRLEEKDSYIPNPTQLESLVRDNTKMIIINNPNNPFGTTIPRGSLTQIIDFARPRGLIVMADEVYRPLFHSLPEHERSPPSILSLGYDKTISTSSMSKAWSLAGIRFGWIATRDEEIMTAIKSARNYTTISVSQLDDQIAGLALSAAVRPSLLRRNIELAQTNLALLEAFVHKYSEICSWTKPAAGTTAMIRFERRGQSVKDDEFCLEVLEKTRVLVMPGSTCFGGGEYFEGYMRFGYVSSTKVLKEALDALGHYLENGFAHGG
ncbi:Aspartate aminotransferase [Emericellopsis cladophorae]|uniref:Aspartate aminotransferase n=1 Tax=Emericellopsis cladophorae TaxID=2686198 RepID=A0A9P9Y840_9HYPO|nr:Aspartate aminotransferase [Emericellopsis cladophorae]KAI6785277.1 Aspartate aminotransferase [Emericellopsis cladophorae]